MTHAVTAPRAAPDSQRRFAVTAGAGILLIAALSALVAVVGPAGLLTGSGTADTVNDIVASPGRFELSIASLFVVALLDVVVAWALFHLFATSNRGLAGLAAGARAAYASLFALAIAQLLGVSSDLGGASPPSDQARAAASAGLADFRALWLAALVLFGIHLVLVGRLAYTSRLVPRVVAVLVALAGLGYLVDSIATWLFSDYTFSVGTLTAVGELLLGICLLAQGFSGRTAHTQSLEITTPERAPSSR